MSDENIVKLVSVKPNKDVLLAELDKAIGNYMNIAAAMELIDIGAFYVRQKHLTNAAVAIGVISSQKHIWDIFKQYMKAINATRQLLDLEMWPSDAAGFANALLVDQRQYSQEQLDNWHAQVNIKAKQRLFDEVGEGKDVVFLVKKMQTMTEEETRRIMSPEPEKKDDDA